MDLIRLKSIFPEMILNVVVFRGDQALSEDNSGRYWLIWKFKAKCVGLKSPFQSNFMILKGWVLVLIVTSRQLTWIWHGLWLPMVWSFITVTKKEHVFSCPVLKLRWQAKDGAQSLLICYGTIHRGTKTLQYSFTVSLLLRTRRFLGKIFHLK